jgi:hypothetical protein
LRISTLTEATSLIRTATSVDIRRASLQLFGHRHAEIAKRVDIAATAIFHSLTVDELSDLDLSYTPPLGSPWVAIQMGVHVWLREASHP